jgi:hypothetical protein
MQQVAALAERVRALKSIAASMHEGRIHTQLVPEIDKILALPDDVAETTSVGEREAVARQVREYEQIFDGLGYTLLDQIMPSTGVSAIFRIVEAADEFKASLRKKIGRTLPIGPEPAPLATSHVEALSRYSLSIGTPPVTGVMRELISRIVFGKDSNQLRGFVEILDCDPLALGDLLNLLSELVDGSLHYNTATEEAAFLREAAEFVNFEGATLLNRVVITASPERAIHLIENHVFDKFGPNEMSAVQVVEGIDRLDAELIARMQAEPNQVFVARVTHIPHRLFLSDPSGENPWRAVLGRLLLVDCSPRATLSNTTIVYMLFPHVARTLRNVQTGFAGRPANTQLTLRRVLERMDPKILLSLQQAAERALKALEAEGVLGAKVDEIRAHDWRRNALFDYLSLVKLRRILAFLHQVATAGPAERERFVSELTGKVTADWMRYFYGGLPRDSYKALVVPGGGRGALSLVGEYHRDCVRKEVKRFCDESLAACRERLASLKAELAIPTTSSDEIEAAIKQSQLAALAPTQWNAARPGATRLDHLARTLLYRAADAASRASRKAEQGLGDAVFKNVTGGAAALFKETMTRAGLGALHGHLEDRYGKKIGAYDRRMRGLVTPVHEAVRGAQRAMDELKGELDPTAVGDIEALLKLIERGAFYPILIIAEMSWSYGDVFPDKDFPTSGVIRVPLNERFELDPWALLRRLEELRYLYRRFPEIFRLYCKSMLLVVNTPHNPTGVAYRKETLLKILQIASEYGITLVDDNAYHKLVVRSHKAREGDKSLAQLYERHKAQLAGEVRLITASATTKGLQGSGDRTGIIHSNDPEAIEFCAARSSAPHLLSLYLTRLKLESGLAAKRVTGELEDLAARLVAPTERARASASLREKVAAMMEDARADDFPVAVFEALLTGYEDLLRLEQRGATVKHLSEGLSDLVRKVKQLRLEVRLRGDVQRRFDAFVRAAKKAAPQAEIIPPTGAFYACLRLCAEGDDRGLQDFLRAIARHRKVDATYAGKGFVRISLGGELKGDADSYARYEKALTAYLGLLWKNWQDFCAAGRKPEALNALFFPQGEGDLTALFSDLAPLLSLDGKRSAKKGQPIRRSERGFVYCIEEGRSIADKVFVDWQPCDSVDQLLHSRAFRVLYRRLLRKVWQKRPELMDLSFEQVEAQYGPLACLAAYHDRQLIDTVFRDLLLALYQEWHGQSTIKVLSARLQTGSHGEKVASLQGIQRRVNDLINELMHAFDVPDEKVDATSTFEIGFEGLEGVKAHPTLPGYLQQIIAGAVFAGATAPLEPAPSFVTGAAKRVSDYRYGFSRRDAVEGAAPEQGRPSLDYFQARLTRFAQAANLRDYVCKAVPVGPFKMLVVLHKSDFHLVSDEMRLFPQIGEMQVREKLDRAEWDAVMLFGIPSKCIGDGYKTGWILDRRSDGRILPTAWVAREDDTDYVGFFKKTLLTLHNELVKALGGMPVHGAMITITFKNGLRKTLVFSADSGTGKSETITAMMDQLAQGEGTAAELKRVDILAGDMLSLWRGEDGQLYAFGSEQGDFLRLNDITESWKARFGDLLKRGSYSNVDHPKNPRVTIPGICDPHKFLMPTRVNGFFYINNYEAPRASAVQLSDDPHHVLKSVLVRGLRKNKGTSGDQPSLRAGLEFAGKGELVVRYRHVIDEILEWQERVDEGKQSVVLAFRDGSGDVFTAREIVQEAFHGARFKQGDKELVVHSVEHDILRNLYVLHCGLGGKATLTREVYDQIYEPLASTFCGNPFVEPAEMDQVLETFAETMRAAKVHTGVIHTQLARKGYEFTGPAKSARDIIGFLLEDEEVAARFQRNKDKVHQAMLRTFGGVIEAGSNLPVELEGYNLLLLEAHESTHVAFMDGARRFTLSTPFYRYEPAQGERAKAFSPAIAVPEVVAAIRDILQNPDHALDLSALAVDLKNYDRIVYWNSREELVYQVLLINGVVFLGAEDSEVVRFPSEVRKADHIASLILAVRAPQLNSWVPRFRVVANGAG